MLHYVCESVSLSHFVSMFVSKMSKKDIAIDVFVIYDTLNMVETFCWPILHRFLFVFLPPKEIFIWSPYIKIFGHWSWHPNCFGTHNLYYVLGRSAGHEIIIDTIKLIKNLSISNSKYKIWTQKVADNISIHIDLCLCYILIYKIVEYLPKRMAYSL